MKAEISDKTLKQKKTKNQTKNETIQNQIGKITNYMTESKMTINYCENCSNQKK